LLHERKSVKTLFLQDTFFIEKTNPPKADKPESLGLRPEGNWKRDHRL